jgi:hypothetical protein
LGTIRFLIRLSPCLRRLTSGPMSCTAWLGSVLLRAGICALLCVFLVDLNRKKHRALL